MGALSSTACMAIARGLEISLFRLKLELLHERGTGSVASIPLVILKSRKVFVKSVIDVIGGGVTCRFFYEKSVVATFCEN